MWGERKTEDGQVCGGRSCWRLGGWSWGLSGDRKANIPGIMTAEAEVLTGSEMRGLEAKSPLHQAPGAGSTASWSPPFP